MDRQAILKKIAALLKLQESSTFSGESDAAAAKIDELCSKYGVTLYDATVPEVLEEEFYSTKRMDPSLFILFCAVARFYDAKGFVRATYDSGRKLSTFYCIGTEAQQIQTKLYYEYLKDVMQKEVEKAIKGEEILAQIQGKLFSKTGFKSNFCKEFSFKVRDRLDAMKLSREDHEHKQYTLAVVSNMKFVQRKIVIGSNGRSAGANCGSSVSLNKQTSGSHTLQLTGR